jgi:hypothetical protein
LARLLSAALDGCAIQAAIDPEIDRDNPYRVLTRPLESSLPAFSQPMAAAGGDVS